MLLEVNIKHWYNWLVFLSHPKPLPCTLTSVTSLIDPATPPSGPVTATPNSAYEYIVLPNHATHNMAVQLCADRGATLPMPKTQAENDALDAFTSEGGTFFLGLR